MKQGVNRLSKEKKKPLKGECVLMKRIVLVFAFKKKKKRKRKENLGKVITKEKKNKEMFRL